jgi:hypothetical protein
VAAVAVVLLCLWFGRGIVAGPNDTAVRHGISTNATVTAVHGDEVRVRYFNSSGPLFATIPAQGGHAYAVGDTLAVVHDPYWQHHVSERGLPPATGAGTRALLLLVAVGGAAAAYAALSSGRGQRRDHTVGGGREKAKTLAPART